MNKFGLSDSLIQSASSILGAKKIDEDMSVHVAPHPNGTHYVVKKVGEGMKKHGGVKVGERLSDTHIDDLRDSDITVKHVKEEVVEEDTEEVEEASGLETKTLQSYSTKASDARGHRKLSTKKVDNRYAGVKKASDELERRNKQDLGDEVEHDASSTFVEAVRAKLQEAHPGHKMDPVGQEDDDVDNDGDTDSSDEYLKKRRKAIKKAMNKEEVQQVDELSTDTMGSYVKKATNSALALTAKGQRLKGQQDVRQNHSRIGSDELEKAAKRQKGIHTAVNKITKKATSGNLEDEAQPDSKLSTFKEMMSKKKLKEGMGDEEPKSSGQAAQLAKHYYMMAKRASSVGNTEAAQKYMSAAKKFYNKSDHMQARDKEGHSSAQAETFWSDAELTDLRD